MFTSEVFLLTGSNLGNREFFLDFARKELKGAGTILKASAVYESLPWGYKSSYPFLNQCVKMGTNLQPVQLLKSLKKIEKQAGRRKRDDSYEDRCLDIDILFYGQHVISQNGLVIPHPRLHLRAFALVPLAEIAGDFVHPLLNKTVRELLEESEDDVLPVRVEKR